MAFPSAFKAQVWSPPAATLLNAPGGAFALPPMFQPQQATLPSVFSAQVYSGPAAICRVSCSQNAPQVVSRTIANLVAALERHLSTAVLADELTLSRVEHGGAEPGGAGCTLAIARGGAGRNHVTTDHAVAPRHARCGRVGVVIPGSGRARERQLPTLAAAAGRASAVTGAAGDASAVTRRTARRVGAGRSARCGFGRIDR